MCILDGVSFYEARHHRVHTRKLVVQLADLARSNPLVLRLLLTTPLRTHYITQRLGPELMVAEIPEQVGGAKEGLNIPHIISSTEKRAGPDEKSQSFFLVGCFDMLMDPTIQRELRWAKLVYVGMLEAEYGL